MAHGTVDVGMAPLIRVYDMNEALGFLPRHAWASRGRRRFRREVDTPEGRCLPLVLAGGWAPADLMLNSAHDAGERPPARDPARQAAHDDLCLWSRLRRHVDAAAAWLRGSRGLEVEGPSTAAYGMRQTWLHDPDGLPALLSETGQPGRRRRRTGAAATQPRHLSEGAVQLAAALTRRLPGQAGNRRRGADLAAGDALQRGSERLRVVVKIAMVPVRDGPRTCRDPIPLARVWSPGSRGQSSSRPVRARAGRTIRSEERDAEVWSRTHR